MTVLERSQIYRLAFLIALLVAAIAAVASAGELPMPVAAPEQP